MWMQVGSENLIGKTQEDGKRTVGILLSIQFSSIEFLGLFILHRNPYWSDLTAIRTIYLSIGRVSNRNTGKR